MALRKRADEPVQKAKIHGRKNLPAKPQNKEAVWELGDLAGIRDIAEHYGYGVPAVSQWPKRYKDFPTLLLKISGKPVYSLKQVKEWHLERWGI